VARRSASSGAYPRPHVPRTAGTAEPFPTDYAVAATIAGVGAAGHLALALAALAYLTNLLLPAL